MAHREAGHLHAARVPADVAAGRAPLLRRALPRGRRDGRCGRPLERSGPWMGNSGKLWVLLRFLETVTAGGGSACISRHGREAGA